MIGLKLKGVRIREKSNNECSKGRIVCKEGKRYWLQMFKRLLSMM